MEMLLFDIDGDSYGVDLTDVEEVLHMPTLRTIPSAPPFLAGVLNFRGQLIPVIDMLERLGIPRPPAPPQLNEDDDVESQYQVGTRLLLTSNSEARYAVIMDGWRGIREFADDSYRSGVITDNAKAPFINGLNLTDGKMLQRILLHKILYPEELQSLQQDQIDVEPS